MPGKTIESTKKATEQLGPRQQKNYLWMSHVRQAGIQVLLNNPLLTLLLSLFIWSGVVIYAYCIDGEEAYFILGINEKKARENSRTFVF